MQWCCGIPYYPASAQGCAILMKKQMLYNFNYFILKPSHKEAKMYSNLKNSEIEHEQNVGIGLVKASVDIELEELERKMQHDLEYYGISDISQINAAIQKEKKNLEDKQQLENSGEGFLIEKLEARISGLVGLTKNVQRIELLRRNVERDSYSEVQLMALLEKLPKHVSAETSLRRLIYLLSLRRLDVTTLTLGEQKLDLDSEIRKTAAEFKSRLAIEELKTENIAKLLAMSEQRKNTGDFASACQQLEALLKELRPFDFQKMLTLIEKAKLARDQVKGQEIVLLLGPTGVGKSTLLLKLGGCALKKIKQKGLTHFVPMSVPNKALAAITTSPEARSETRYISAVSVDYTDEFDSKQRSIMVCDTPGFDDTNGPEVDVANGVGVVAAVQQCKSVRPVVLISSKSVGDRGQGIKRMAHLLTKIIPNLPDVLSTFSFFFTKYDASSANEIFPTLKSIYQNLTEEEKKDDAFAKLFLQMLRKIKKSGPEVIDPLKDDRNDILLNLSESDAISHPDEAFQAVITEGSRATLQEQVRKHQLSILFALKRGDFILIKAKLDELQMCGKALKQGVIGQVYEDCIKAVGKRAGEYYSEATSAMDKCLLDDNALTLADLDAFNQRASAVGAAAPLREQHIDSEVVQKPAFRQYILKLGRTLQEKIASSYSDTNLLGSRLEKLKLLSQHYHDLLPQYQLACVGVHQHFSGLLESVKDSFESEAFSECGELFARTAQILKTLTGFVEKEDELTTMREVLRVQMLQSFTEREQRISKLLSEGTLDTKSYVELEKVNRSFSELSTSLVLVQQIDTEALKLLRKKLLQSVIQYFKKFEKRIKALFEAKRERSLGEVELLAKEMHQLHELTGVGSYTADMYYSTIEELCACVKSLSKDADRMLAMLVEQPDNVDYQRLDDVLVALEQAKWLDEFKEGIHSDLLNDVHEKILSHAHSIQKLVTAWDADLRDLDGLKQIHALITRLEAMKPFEKSIAGLEKIRVNTRRSFDGKLQANFSQCIESIYVHRKNKAVVISSELNQLKQLLREYNQLQLSQLFLQEHDYKDETALLQARENSEAAKLNTQYQLAINEFSKELEALKKLRSACELSKGSSPKGKLSAKQRKERRQLLKQEGFADFTELKAAIEEKEKKSFQARANNKKQQQSLIQAGLKLEQMVVKYNQLKQDNKKPSHDQIITLHKAGYNSIRALQEAIALKSFKVQSLEKIAETSSQEQSVDSSEFDFQLTEEALIYLKTCASLSLVAPKAKLVKRQLDKLIMQHVRQVQQELRQSFNLISSSALTRAEIMTCIQTVCLVMQRFDKHQTSCKQVCSYYPKQFLADNIRQLKEYQLDLSAELQKLEIGGDKAALQNRLVVARAMSALDTYLDDADTFLVLYRQYRQKLYSSARKTSVAVIEAIKNSNFQKVAAEIIGLKSIKDEVGEYTLKQILQILSNKITALAEENKTKAIMLQSNLTPEEIDTIVKGLSQIKQAQTFVGQYLDKSVQDHISNSIETLKTTVSERLRSFLDRIRAFVRANNFYEAGRNLEIAKKVIGLLGIYCEKKAKEEYEQLQNTLGDMLDSVVEKYKDMKINMYWSTPPADIFVKFQKVCNESPLYSEKLEQIKAAIFGNLRKEIEEIRQCPPAERRKRTREFRAALPYLPENIRRTADINLADLHVDLEEEKKEMDTAIDDALQSRSIATIAELLKEHRKSGPEARAQFNKLKKGVSDIVHTLKAEIDKNLDDNSASTARSAFENIKNLCEIKQQLGELVPQITNPFASLRVRFLNNFDNAYKELDNFISMGQQELPTQDQVYTIEKSFEALQTFVDLMMSFKETSFITDILPRDFKVKIEQLYQKLANFFNANQQRCDQAFNNKDIHALRESMSLLQCWDGLFKKTRRHMRANDYANILQIKPLVSAVQSGKSYSDFKKVLSRNLKGLVEQIKLTELMSDKTCMKSDKQLSEYFKKLNSGLQTLMQIRLLKEHIDVDVLQPDSLKDELEKAFKSNLEQIATMAAKSARDNTSSYDTFNICHKHLVAIGENITLLKKQAKNATSHAKQLLFEKVQHSESQYQEHREDINVAVESLIAIKRISNAVFVYKQELDERIDKILRAYRSQFKATGLVRLGLLLDKDDSGVGQSIIAEHKYFKGHQVSIFNTKTQKHDIDYVLDNLMGSVYTVSMVGRAAWQDKNGVNPDFRIRLRDRYVEFDTYYRKLTKDYLVKNMDLEPLIEKIKLISGNTRQLPGATRWDSLKREKALKLMAHLFALWTLKSANHYFDAIGVANQESYLLQPHPAQVISIFRMLGIGSKSKYGSNLDKRLIQIGTGEGKSITLAVTATVLALLGFEVSCACYSDYLSTRDRQEFQPIFDMLGLAEYIHYGTFNNLCEKVINDDVDVRDRVKSLIQQKAQNTNVASTSKFVRSPFKSRKTARAKVLLIDEADVFFNQDFYGNLYSPSAKLQSKEIFDLANHIWQQRDSVLSIHGLKRAAVFKACAATFSGWEFLLDEAAKEMLADVKTYASHNYLVQEDKIGYREQDGISFNIVYGYKTLFAYFNEKEKGKITEKSLQDHTFIKVHCGHFSYAEVPLLFDSIMGVSGTLKTLTPQEKQVISERYGIRRFVFMPSVFGKNNLQYSPDKDIRVETKADYFNSIRREINDRLAGTTKGTERAMLVFFKNQEALSTFYKSDAIADIRDSIKFITEETANNEKTALIKRATMSGQVTLLTKAFGRGTDFVCRDQVVAKNGGVHVIQTFISEEISEEIQIKGRAARQGDSGSYSLVLLDHDLEYYQIDKPMLDDMRRTGRYYEVIDKKRNAFFKAQYANIEKLVLEAKEKHDNSFKFLRSVDTGALQEVKDQLQRYNLASCSNTASRTVVLMDATGSMSYLIDGTKATIGTMFDRASQVLKDSSMKQKNFAMQFVAYRNYNSKEDKLLQSSTWESKPEDLRAFLKTVRAEGGWGNEAIEVGFWHVNQEAERSTVSQVILIGDAPANSTQEVSSKRGNFGESYWRGTKFARPTDMTTELKQLQQKGIPVHAFFVANRAKQCFQKIAKTSSGRTEFLDINSSSGADTLTNLVTEQVLRNIGGDPIEGEALVKAYRQRFTKSYTS